MEFSQQAFDALKKVITKEPNLSYPNLSKPFKLHMDAFNFTVGGVLMQEGHSIPFGIQKLNDTERRHMV